MQNSEIFFHVDHTLLKATSSWEEIDLLCQEAINFKTASVCIPSCYVKRVKTKYQDDLTICTVIGFPLGYSVTAAKVAEAEQAILDGAEEVDMVINLCDVKNGDYDKVEQEICTLRNATKGKILKVIIETCYLTDSEKKDLCQIVTKCNADYIKTSTGFGTKGATVEDVRLFQGTIGSDVKIKAAGGIHKKEDMVEFLNMGVERLGTSSAVKILCGQETNDY